MYMLQEVNDLSVAAIACLFPPLAFRQASTTSFVLCAASEKNQRINKNCLIVSITTPGKIPTPNNINASDINAV